MKKKYLVIALFVITISLLSSVTALANNENLSLGKKPFQTPGAQATANAILKPTHESEPPELTETAPAQGKLTRTYRGEILTVTADTLVMQQSDGTIISFLLDTATRIKIPSLGHPATFLDLATGQTVNIKARNDGTGIWTTLSIHVVPGKPTLFDHEGIVTAYTPGKSLTLLDHKGSAITFILTANTKILPANRAALLQVGVEVTVICPRDVSGTVFTAKAIVIHPQSVITGTPESTKEPKGTKTPRPDQTPEPTELPAR